MRFKLFASIIILFCSVAFLTCPVSAIYPAPPIPPSINNSESQILVVYKPNQNPQQIIDALKAKREKAGNLSGKISMFFSELAGITPGESYYTNQLKAIQNVQKKAQVVSEKNLYSPKPNNPSTVVITLQKGANITTAIKLYLSLPQVVTASPNSVNSIQSIQSEESNPYEIAKHQIIVQYKEGTTPEEISDAVEERARVASQPIIGQVRIAAMEAADALQGNQTPRELQEEYADVKEKAGFLTSEPLIDESKAPTPLENAQVVKLEADTPISTALDAYKSLSTVDFAVPNSVVLPVDTPNDPMYSQEWGLEKIQAAEAWNVAKGSDSITVAVIDSGIDYDHPDLAAHVIKGENFVPGEDPGNPMDACGHGTHVAGTIGALTNNSTGVAGVNWNIKLQAIKVFSGSCSGNLAPIVSAIHYAADNGAKVINMSLGGTGSCGVYQEAVDYAKNAGVTVVVAAGNSSMDASNFAPANCNGVLTVGASTSSDGRASFSNYGSVVAIAAPGAGIMSTMMPTSVLGTSRCSGSSYCLLDGTSMATPHVAGAAALLFSVNSSLTSDRVKEILVSNADSISTDQPIGPRLNLLKAIQAVDGGGGTTPTPASPSGTITPTPTTPGEPTPTTPIGSTPTPTTPPRDNTPTPTEPPPPVRGRFTFSINLPGIGPGENTNPQPSIRWAVVEFLDQDGFIITDERKVELSYQFNSFMGSLQLDGIAPGTYQLRVKMPGKLPKFVRGFYTVNSSDNNITLPTVNLTSGDMNGDEILDILDYNILITTIQRGGVGTMEDLNSDGRVNAADLNIFLRQLNSRVGD